MASRFFEQPYRLCPRRFRPLRPLLDAATAPRPTALRGPLGQKVSIWRYSATRRSRSPRSIPATMPTCARNSAICCCRLCFMRRSPRSKTGSTLKALRGQFPKSFCADIPMCLAMRAPRTPMRFWCVGRRSSAWRKAQANNNRFSTECAMACQRCNSKLEA